MSKTPTKKMVEVAQVEGAEVPVKVLAQAILDISAAMKKLLDGPLNRRALVLLIQDASGCSKRDISMVIDSIHALDQLYVKKQGQK